MAEIEMREFLQGCSLGQFTDAFAENAVYEVRMLLRMSDAELKELQEITSMKFGHRMTLKGALDELRKTGGATATAAAPANPAPESAPSSVDTVDLTVDAEPGASEGTAESAAPESEKSADEAKEE